jgi:V8-like Glu-specific endopeptidase
MKILIVTLAAAGAVICTQALSQPFTMPDISKLKKVNPEVKRFANEAAGAKLEEYPVTVRGIVKGDAKPADLTIDPYLWVGRLIINERTSCTAQLVAAVDMVLTAAHCVYSPGTREWANKIQFTRTYGGNSPEVLDGKCAAIYKGWADKGDFGIDYAWIQTKTNGRAYLGIVENGMSGLTDDFFAAGYPQNFGNAQIMQTVNGTLGSKSASKRIAAMVANTMTYGASGGAWLNDRRQVIGLNSFINSKRPNVMFGPVFDHNVMALFDRLRDGKPDSDINIKCF